MKRDIKKFLLAIILIVSQISTANAVNDLTSVEYKSLAYIVVPFSGFEVDSLPRFGFVTTRKQFNNIQAAISPLDYDQLQYVRSSNLIDIRYDLNTRKWTKFTINGFNALNRDISYNNFAGAGINPIAAVVGAGLAVGGVVLSAASNSTSDNHMCEEEHHDEEEEEHDDFANFNKIVFNIHPCPESEEEPGDHEDEGEDDHEDEHGFSAK